MLSIFLTPAMAIMSRLNFALKIGLVGLLFCVPIAGLTIHLRSKINADIQASELERLGVRQIVPARHLVEAVLDHRAAARWVLSGNKTAMDQLAAATARVDNKLNSLGDINTEQGAALKTQTDFDAIAKQWRDLRTKLLGFTVEQSAIEHSKLVDDIFKYIRKTADNSNMTLDIDVDSFTL